MTDIVDELREYADLLDPDLGGATLLRDAADEIERQRHYMGLLSQENKELLEENLRMEVDRD